MAWIWASGFRMGIVYDVANEIMNALAALEKNTTPLFKRIFTCKGQMLIRLMFVFS